MAAKRKCRYCGAFAYDHIKINSGSFCNFSHATKWAMDKSAKDKAKAIRKASKALKQKDTQVRKNSTKTRKAAAKAACHAYIWERDKGKNCICCDKPINRRQAGHFIPSGQNPKLRYHEDNIHCQNLNCNYFKGGDSGDYERNLRLKIGDERVDWLLTQKGGTMKRTADDYKAIELYYKAKLKELAA